MHTIQADTLGNQHDGFNWFGQPPNNGRPVGPTHLNTFLGRITGGRDWYAHADEEIRRHDPDALERMVRDLDIMPYLRQRQLATALLEWQILPEDDRDTAQAEICDQLTQQVKRTPRFNKYSRWLLSAIWYGRAGIFNQFRYDAIHGDRLVVSNWRPIHGDKIDFGGQATGRPEKIGVKVQIANADAKQEAGYRSQLQVLDPTTRKCTVIHQHDIADGSFWVPWEADRIHGVGLQHYVYWYWWLKQKLLQWLMDWGEKFGQGITLWYFDEANPADKAAVETAAQEQSGDTVLLVPRYNDGNGNFPRVERIEPSTGGADLFQNVLNEYFGAKIRRMITGQDLTSESGSTGLGSNLATIHQDTFFQLITYDAQNLAETYTAELLPTIASYTRNMGRLGFQPRFEFVTEKSDPKETMEAVKLFTELGGEVAIDDVREELGFRKPDEGEEVLKVQSGPAGDIASGMPGMGGPPPTPSKPKGDRFTYTTRNGTQRTVAGRDNVPKSARSVQRAQRDDEPLQYAGQWDESKHPRADDGKFGSGPGASGGSPEPNDAPSQTQGEDGHLPDKNLERDLDQLLESHTPDDGDVDQQGLFRDIIDAYMEGYRSVPKNLDGWVRATLGDDAADLLSGQWKTAAQKAKEAEKAERKAAAERRRIEGEAKTLVTEALAERGLNGKQAKQVSDAVRDRLKQVLFNPKYQDAPEAVKQKLVAQHVDDVAKHFGSQPQGDDTPPAKPSPEPKPQPAPNNPPPPKAEPLPSDVESWASEHLAELGYDESTAKKVLAAMAGPAGQGLRSKSFATKSPAVRQRVVIDTARQIAASQPRKHSRDGTAQDLARKWFTPVDGPLRFGEWNEEDHPRADDGKFGSGGSTGEGGDQASQPSEEDDGVKRNADGFPDATDAYSKDVVPKGSYVHGRAGRQDLDTGNVLQLTDDWYTAEQYAGDSGSMWMLTPHKDTVVMDMTKPENMEKVIEALRQDWEDDNLPHRLQSINFDEIDDDQLMDEIDVEDIVSTAGWWDNQDFVGWFWDRFEQDMAIVSSGALVLNHEGLHAQKVDPDAEPRQYARGFDESKHPRAADGKFGSGGGKGDSKPKDKPPERPAPDKSDDPKPPGDTKPLPVDEAIQSEALELEGVTDPAAKNLAIRTAETAWWAAKKTAGMGWSAGKGFFKLVNSTSTFAGAVAAEAGLPEPVAKVATTVATIVDWSVPGLPAGSALLLVGATLKSPTAPVKVTWRGAKSAWTYSKDKWSDFQAWRKGGESEQYGKPRPKAEDFAFVVEIAKSIAKYPEGDARDRYVTLLIFALNETNGDLNTAWQFADWAMENDDESSEGE